MPSQRLRVRALWLAAAVVLASALSACGSSSSTATDPTAPDPTNSAASHTGDDTVKPASGPMLSAHGFSFHAPHGWSDVTDRAETGVLLSAAHVTDEQPLVIDVRRVTPGARSQSGARARATALLKTASATGIRALPDTRVDGYPAAHVMGKQDLHGAHFQIDVYYVRTPHAGWPLTFATDEFTTKSRRSAMLASVLKTCHWDSAA